MGEMSGESSHCSRLIRLGPSGMSKLSLSTAASASGSVSLAEQTRTHTQHSDKQPRDKKNIKKAHLSDVSGVLNSDRKELQVLIFCTEVNKLCWTDTTCTHSLLSALVNVLFIFSFYYLCLFCCCPPESALKALCNIERKKERLWVVPIILIHL